MGAVEDVVDAAASFIGPFVEKNTKDGAHIESDHDPDRLVEQAIAHLQAINTAELAADPDAPYDASLAGVVYALLDVVTTLGILPHLSSGVAFSQRPRTVLTTLATAAPKVNEHLLASVMDALLPILEQEGSGVQPLITQRILPDILSALVELAFSPVSTEEARQKFSLFYQRTLPGIPTSRLLPILTIFLQQPLPAWLMPIISKELSLVPLRPHGVRHTIEFLSLSYLTKNSRIPQDAAGPQSQALIPLEAITHASRLLVLPPMGTNQDTWLRQLSPQLWSMLDGQDGGDLSRAAGQIIAGGILSKKATGAPGTAGWELFARPIIDRIYPIAVTVNTPQRANDRVFVCEQDLQQALMRLSAIASAYSHAGLLRRLVGPVLLPLWALLYYTQGKSALDKRWQTLPRTILSRYLAIACDAHQIDTIAISLFWDGDSTWTFGPGSHGGVEIRQRTERMDGLADMENILTRIGSLDARVSLFVSLLVDAKIPDNVAGSIFLQATRRWLSPSSEPQNGLRNDTDDDPLAALIDAKVSEAMATNFNEQFARSPQHIIELMNQLLQNFVSEHRAKVQKLTRPHTPSRTDLENIVKKGNVGGAAADSTDSADEDLISFAMSVLSTLVSSPDFQRTPETIASLVSTIIPLSYLSRAQRQIGLSPLIINSANALLHLLQVESTPSHTRSTDPLDEHRATLKTVMQDLMSPEPPNRTWALITLRKLIVDHTAFPIIDVPSATHLLLSASLADPESYVHTAAVPVLVDLAIQAPTLVVRILVDAFVDIDEQALKLGRDSRAEEKDKQLQEALDFRLRVGEVLNNFVLDDVFWSQGRNTAKQYTYVRHIIEACLSLASRRGQRTETLSARGKVAEAEHKLQEEGEAAWGGPIPNLLDPEGENPEDQAERDALLKIVQDWEDTGIEEDVRIRASALSVLSTVLEHRCGFLRQVTIDAVLQMVLLLLGIETSEAKGILRRAAVLVIMGLLRGLDAALESGEADSVAISVRQQEEVERMVRWVRDEDIDVLTRDHAVSVLEGLEILRMKKLYKIRDESGRLGPNLGLDGNLRGLDVRPVLAGHDGGRKRMVIEEIE
jgi:hypothetical protein